jgi:membrane associated rhomboid family serine protease
MPAVIGVLIAITVVASILGALLPIVSHAALVPAEVTRGQLWRLMTWVFFEGDPIALLFACLLLYWFGRDLSWAWGARRFVLSYLGLTVLVGAITTGIGLLLGPPASVFPYVTSWPLAEAMTIAWATLYPDRQIMAYFVVPMSGKNLIYFTVGLTLLFGIFKGLQPLVPHFAAEGVTLLYMGAGRRLWMRLQLKLHDRARRRHLHVVGTKTKSGPGPWLN